MASIKLKGDTSGEVTIQAPAVAGTTTLNLPATSSTLATQNSLGVRNLIINGDMRIDQRNAGASVILPSNTNYYTIDRFAFTINQASKMSAQQVTDAPTGFVNSLKVTTTSAYTVTASDYFSVRQDIEGQNISHLDWGSSNAKTVTLSFYVKSSLTGTFGGSLKNSAGTKAYPYTYTIDSANTWERKTITIEGETTGTWLTTNGRGIMVYFGLGVGSTFSGTSGSWASSNYLSATGATSVVGTSGATWQVTGVQLEVGDTATPFEHRPYDMELARCQRYYYQINNSATTTDSTFALGNSGGGTNLFNCTTPLPVTMRTTPSISASSATQFKQVISYVGIANLTSGPTINTGNSSPFIAQYYWSTNSVGSAGQAAILQSNTATYTYLGFSAEL